MTTFDPQERSLYIPAPGSSLALFLAPGSAAVGLASSPAQRANPDAIVVIDYEGNLYNASNLSLFSQRAFHAWSRQTERYPSSARRAAPLSELVEIGRFNDRGDIAWLNIEAASAWSQESPEQLIKGRSDAFDLFARSAQPGRRRF